MPDFRRVEVPGSVSGVLYLSSMPGRHEKWEHFISSASDIELDLLVCLASESEIERKSPRYYSARATGSLPFRVRDFAIEDHGAPLEAQLPAFRRFIADIASELEAGRVVLVHCYMGIGRTGLVASCILIHLGADAKDAVQKVWRAGSEAEVAEQRKIIAWYSDVTQG